MHNRLIEIIKYRTGGKQTTFASLMGWSPQYLSKLVRGKDFGIAPVIALLKKLPEINARWLLLGEGQMLQDAKLSEVRAVAQTHILSILEMEKYLPVMTPSEVRAFEQMCVGEALPQFSNEQIKEWQKLLSEIK
jgi:hypothetical protein